VWQKEDDWSKIYEEPMLRSAMSSSTGSSILISSASRQGTQSKRGEDVAEGR
jgi:hypothetical protein